MAVEPKYARQREKLLLSGHDNLLLSAIKAMDLSGRPTYGGAIYDYLNESVAPKKVSYGSLYPSLEKLERKGLLRSEMKEYTTIFRGTNIRRYFHLTELGSTEIDLYAQAMDRLRETKKPCHNQTTKQNQDLV